MDKSTISMEIFNSKLLVYQRIGSRHFHSETGSEARDGSGKGLSRVAAAWCCGWGWNLSVQGGTDGSMIHDALRHPTPLVDIIGYHHFPWRWRKVELFFTDVQRNPDWTSGNPSRLVVKAIKTTDYSQCPQKIHTSKPNHEETH